MTTLNFTTFVRFLCAIWRLRELISPCNPSFQESLSAILSAGFPCLPLRAQLSIRSWCTAPTCRTRLGDCRSWPPRVPRSTHIRAPRQACAGPTVPNARSRPASCHASRPRVPRTTLHCLGDPKPGIAAGGFRVRPRRVRPSAPHCRPGATG